MSAPSTAAWTKGDHFSLFGLPRKLWIEMSALEKKFLELSWKLHPDKFVNAAAAEQELSLKRSSELNDAYRALRDPVARVELREAKASGGDLGSLKSRLESAEKNFQEKLTEVDTQLQEAAQQWDAAADANAGDADR